MPTLLRGRKWATCGKFLENRPISCERNSREQNEAGEKARGKGGPPHPGLAYCKRQAVPCTADWSGPVEAGSSRPHGRHAVHTSLSVAPAPLRCDLWERCCQR